MKVTPGFSSRLLTYQPKKGLIFEAFFFRGDKMETTESLISKAKVCRLGLADENQPYVVPLCFGYRENTLLFSHRKKGPKDGHPQKQSKGMFRDGIGC